jgi:hypothetical protein
LIDLFRPRLIVSSKVFQVVFVRLVYNSVLFLESCSFFILDTYRSQFDFYLIIFSSTCSSLIPSKFLNSFCGQIGCTVCSSEKFHLDCCQSLFVFFYKVQISLPYKRKCTVSALYYFQSSTFTLLSTVLKFNEPSVSIVLTRL